MFALFSLNKIIVGLLSAIVAALAASTLTMQYGMPQPASLIEPCVNNVMKSVFPNQTVMDSYRAANDYCSTQIHSELVLRDFAIRRSAFALQGLMGQIVLWMVVIVTLSGVGLSAMQLLASFRLAQKAGESSLSKQEQTLTVEQGKLVISTSVTGVMVLAVSFGFFYVFVSSVYRLDEMRQGHAAATDVPIYTTAAPQGPLMGGGKLEPATPKAGAK